MVLFNIYFQKYNDFELTQKLLFTKTNYTMDFARKQLEKYGWTDGKGLGKNENGISEALKPKLKRSITGIGYDAAKDFTEHWWSALYDKAANNVQVEEKNGKTKKMKQKDENFEITNSTWKLKRKSKDKEEKEYSEFFIKTAVIDTDETKSTRVEDSDSNSDNANEVVTMTDEALFAACQGRTAHKGARHGLRALGKLARIEEQERLLLQQSKYKGYSHTEKNKKSPTDLVIDDTNLNSDPEITVKKKKKKKNRCSSNDNYRNANEKVIHKSDETKEISSNSENKGLEILMDVEEPCDYEKTDESEKPKKKKRKRHHSKTE